MPKRLLLTQGLKVIVTADDQSPGDIREKIEEESKRPNEIIIVVKRPGVPLLEADGISYLNRLISPEEVDPEKID